MLAFQRLDAAHFVRRQPPPTGFYQGRRVPVQRGQVDHCHMLCNEGSTLSQATLVRLEIGLILQTSPMALGDGPDNATVAGLICACARRSMADRPP